MDKLSELASLYDTDKKPEHHNYTKIYEKLIDTNISSLLEIGFGSGASAKMWIDYLPNANIYSMELMGEEFEKIWKDTANISIPNLNLIIADSTLKESWNNVPFELDVIIDDGNHHPNAQIETFINGFPHLKSSGLYFIEDTHANFMNIYTQGNDIIYNWIFNIIFKQQTASPIPIGDFYKAREYMKGLEKEIFGYQFYKSMIVLEKA